MNFPLLILLQDVARENFFKAFLSCSRHMLHLFPKRKKQLDSARASLHGMGGYLHFLVADLSRSHQAGVGFCRI